VLAEAAIAGFRYYDGMRDEVLATLHPGGELVLRREPENPHDPNAIAIHTSGGRKLGYVPRIDNLTPAMIADPDVPLGAQILAVAPEAPPWERVRVSIYQQIADVPPPDEADRGAGGLPIPDRQDR
jgi:hypothetical protein